MIDVDIRKRWNDFTLDVCFRAEDEILALFGGSGSGKSMTLRAIAGIVTPDEGHIIVNGTVFFDSEKKINLTPQQRQAGLLFQNYALFPTMTVLQNIMTGVRTGSRSQKKDQALAAISRFRLDGLENRYPSQLSGGQQQRVALARILVGKPKILMLDEPFSALDSHLRDQMERETMEILRSFGGTAILVSHDRGEVFRMADRIAVYHNGSIVDFDSKHALFRHPSNYISAQLTGCKNFSRVENLRHENGRTLLYASDWNLELELPGEIHGSMIGIRGHSLYAAEGPGINTYLMEIQNTVEDLFEFVLFLQQPECSGPPIQWMISKSDYPNPPEGSILVTFPPDRLMLVD